MSNYFSRTRLVEHSDVLAKRFYFLLEAAIFRQRHTNSHAWFESIISFVCVSTRTKPNLSIISDLEVLSYTKPH